MKIIKRHKILSILAGDAGLKPAPPVWIFCFLLFTIGTAFSADLTHPILTNAVDVISLPADQASRLIRVHVTGVVTASDRVLKGRFFLQDSTGGVFVDNVNGEHLDPGEMVEVSGITYAGAFAPTVTAPKVKVVGKGTLPLAKPVSIDQLMSGSEDSQRVQISGIVRDAKLDGQRLTIDLVAGGYRFRAFLPSASGFNPEKLVGAEALVRGTAAEAHNRSLRQLIAIEIYIPDSTDLVVEKSDSINPFDRPVIPLNKLAQFRRDSSLAQRVHVRGVVTYQQPGQRVFLQNTTFGLQVQSREKIKVSPGDVVDAVGFLSFENYLPVLQDAVFREAGEPQVQITPQPATSHDLENGLYHANYISISSELIQLTVNAGSSGSQGNTVMVLQTSNFTFTAAAENVPGQAQLANLAIGTTLNVSGIGLAQIDSAGTLQSFQLLVQNASDVRVIKKPSWLTPNRLLIGVLILCSALFLIVSWSLVLSRKNAALNVAIGEREKAQGALQQANDKLEVRVKERTEQLKFEITARKESEVQFKAVLSERTRLAQELHDTLLQGFTGIGLKMEAFCNHLPPDLATSKQQMQKILKQSDEYLDEARRSIWQLRSPSLEVAGNFSDALRKVSLRAIDG
ncbi:MAG TPA: histidine kinase, partial [Candidatus Acidoferrales bacterium]|nr:histidine kinase [Candidatus Acidoferrales bacterium]